jgi:hypothetical protein
MGAEGILMVEWQPYDLSVPNRPTTIELLARYATPKARREALLRVAAMLEETGDVEDAEIATCLRDVAANPEGTWVDDAWAILDTGLDVA